MAQPRLNLPNVITAARILACPVIFALTLSPRVSHLFGAYVLFLAAALSDLWDGYLARKHGQITDIGKLLDPAADKLLLVATFIPFYIVSHRPESVTDIPWWGPMPLWVILVIFGREIAVTAFRMWAARRGQVLSAGQSGKIKAFTQNVFSGSLLLWYPLVRLAEERSWEGETAWTLWAHLHGAVVAAALAVALVLTVYSMGVYAVQHRKLISGGGTGSDTDDLAELAGRALSGGKLRVAVAESCTGGLVLARLTDVPGSSGWVEGGVVAYADRVKVERLGVPAELVEAHGAVSREVARALAEGAVRSFGVEVGIGVTGIAGPGGAVPGKPVGTVWFAVAQADRTSVEMRHFPGDRLEVRARAADHALRFLLASLEPRPQEAGVGANPRSTEG